MQILRPFSNKCILCRQIFERIRCSSVTIHALPLHDQLKFDTVKSLHGVRHWDATKRWMVKKCHIENSYRRGQHSNYTYRLCWPGTSHMSHKIQGYNSYSALDTTSWRPSECRKLYLYVFTILWTHNTHLWYYLFALENKLWGIEIVADLDKVQFLFEQHLHTIYILSAANGLNTYTNDRTRSDTHHTHTHNLWTPRPYLLAERRQAAAQRYGHT